MTHVVNFAEDNANRWLIMQIPMQKHLVNLPEDYADTCSQPGRGLRWQRYQLGKNFAETGNF